MGCEISIYKRLPGFIRDEENKIRRHATLAEQAWSPSLLP